MNEKWLGKRRNSLRLISGQRLSECELKQDAAILYAPRAVLEERMTATLGRVCARVRRSPVYTSNRAAWERIRGLDDLSDAPYTSANLLPLMADHAPDWSKWAIEGETVIATAATSGSTGRSRIMPYTQGSMDASNWSSSPHVARITLERKLPDRPVTLALTAPKGYISYVAIPDGLAHCGYDVLHVPLASVLNDPGVAHDLVDWILEPSNQLHGISAITAMLPMLIAALEEESSGAEALDKMSRSLRFLFSGGSELTPALEAMISTRFGLPSGSYVNLFASTEASMVGCSRDDFGVFHGSFHSHVLSIIPLDELEKEEANPGYQPKNVLLTRAPVGLIGELACVFDGAIPWINLRQGDIFQVVEPLAGSDVPRLRNLARLSSMHDVAGGRVWPASYARAMASLGSKVTDFLAMALKPGDCISESGDQIIAKDKLFFYYEGTADLREIAAAIFDTIPILLTAGPNLGSGSFEMEILNLRAGALRRCRQRKSQERDGSPGPLKHRVVRGPQYQVPLEDVVVSGPGWVPRERESSVSPVAMQVEPCIKVQG